MTFVSQSWLVQAAVTKPHRLGALQTEEILTVLEAGEPKTKVLADSVSGERPLSASAFILQGPHVTEAPRTSLESLSLGP